jgi:hypothetical protein
VTRVLVCTRCRSEIEVFEATFGARTDSDHEHLDPTTYIGGVCGCLQPKQIDGDEPPAWMAVAVGRARTGRERATNNGRGTTT